MLVLARRGVSDEFSDRVGPGKVAAFDDPYEALAAMGRGTWLRIVIEASYVGLDGLCRAVRRLQGDAKLFVLCSPAMEPEVRDLVDGAIDDYFIYPLTSDDWRTLSLAESESSGGQCEPTV